MSADNWALLGCGSVTVACIIYVLWLTRIRLRPSRTPSAEPPQYRIMRSGMSGKYWCEERKKYAGGPSFGGGTLGDWLSFGGSYSTIEEAGAYLRDYITLQKAAAPRQVWAGNDWPPKTP